jgi:phosphopentomutase
VPDPTPFRRAIVIVIDSLGIGELPDAAEYGDAGSNTLGNLAREAHLRIPTLRSLGLANILPITSVPPEAAPRAAYGRMAEVSPGKDSVTGHWELMGLIVRQAFPVFPGGFPEPLMRAFEERVGRGTIGNKPASGTAIIEELGPEHLASGKLIVYTSADSVFQIAAHEQVVPVPELYRACEVAYELVVEGLGMGRVIARPFVGGPGTFKRTANRRDYATPPRGETLLDRAVAAGLPVVAIGKIEDLFAGRGMSTAVHTKSDDEGMTLVARAVAEVPRGLVIANLVDFDTVYGHRNDVAGYAANLERFDGRLAEILPSLRQDDLLVLTADHGNDPTTPSTDHSREYVPIMAFGEAVRAGARLGTRATFADLGQTLAEVFGLAPLSAGTSFLSDIIRPAGGLRAPVASSRPDE